MMRPALREQNQVAIAIGRRLREHDERDLDTRDAVDDREERETSATLTASA